MKGSLRILLNPIYQIEIQETIWHPHIFRDQTHKMFCCTTNNSLIFILALAPKQPLALKL